MKKILKVLKLMGIIGSALGALFIVYNNWSTIITFFNKLENPLKFLLLLLWPFLLFFAAKYLEKNRCSMIYFLAAGLLLIPSFFNSFYTENICISQTTFLLLICYQYYKRINDYDVLKSNTIDKYSDKFFESLIKIDNIEPVKKLITNISDINKHDDNIKFDFNHILGMYLQASSLSMAELKKYKTEPGYPTNLATSFDYVVNQQKQISNHKKSFALSINMMNPKTWLDNDDWRTKYVNPLLTDAMRKPDVDIRRIHILSDEQYSDKKNRLCLNTVLFKEQLAGVDKYSYKINLVFSAEVLKNILKGIPERFKIGVSLPGQPFILDFLPQHLNTVQLG